MKDLKIAFLRSMHEIIDTRIDEYQNTIASLNESRNTATKSSAGDKHETSRALMQTEMDNIQKQLAATLELKQRLLQMPDTTLETGYGSLIKTNKGFFYLSIGLGRMSFSNHNFIAISPTSPLGNLFLGAKKGSAIHFRNDTYEIEDVI